MIARAAAGVVVVAAVVVGVEVELARRGPTLADPVELSGVVRRAGPDARRVLWLGDSTAAGVGAADPGGAVAAQVAEGLGDVELAVLAVSGAVVADVVDDQLPDVAPASPDVVFVSVGANDVTHLTGHDAFADRYRRLVAGLPSSAEVVLLGVPDMGAIPRLHQPLRALAGFRGRQLDEVVRRVAEESGATYVDIAGPTGPAFRRQPDRFFAGDRYHPSSDGYQLWAEAVLDAVPAPLRAP